MTVKLTRELNLLKTETVLEQGEGKLLSRIMRRINLEIGRLRNIAATRTFSTEERVCKLVDQHIKELTVLHQQKTDLKGDRQILEKIQKTIPKIDQLLFLLRAKASLKGENRIAGLRKDLQNLSKQNEAVLKEYEQRSPPFAPEEKIPPLKRGGKRKATPAPISSRLPRKGEMQETRRNAKLEAHRQSKRYVAANLPILIQLALDKGGKDFKKNLKARGVDPASYLSMDFTKMKSDQLYQVAKRIIFEIYEAHPRNDPAFQVVRDLVAEFDRRLFKEGAYRGEL